MNYEAIASFGVTIILMATISLTSPHPVFAGGYEKSQDVSQANECGNYWFPVNIICSNINSQMQNDGNNVVVATVLDTDTNYSPPFP